jgi:hypothetical protein
MKKIFTLMSKAMVSTSLKEKNDLLVEILELWEPQFDIFQRSQSLVRIKNDELTGLQKKLSLAKAKFDKLTENTSFYTRANYVRKRHSCTELVDTIKQTETEISSHYPLTFPNRLQDALSDARTETDIFRIFDLHLRRLEELCKVYRKRLFIVEQSEVSIEQVLRDYGSIHALLDSVHDSEIQHEQLRDEEVLFLGIPATRRRKFSEMSSFCSRLFSSVFQSMLTTERGVINAFRNCAFEAGYSDSPRDIDSVMRDNSFAAPVDFFDTAEFGNTTEPELFQPLIDNLPIQEKIEAYKKVLEKSGRTVRKLEKKIPTGHKLHMSEDASQGRAEKMMCANDELMSRVSILNQMIGTHNEVVHDSLASLIGVCQEKEACSAMFIDHLRQYKALVNSHRELLARAEQNRRIVAMLLHVVSSTGSPMIGDPGEESPVGDLLAGQINAIAKVMQDEDIAAAEALAAQLAALQEEQESNEPWTPINLQQRLTTGRKKQRRAVNARKATVAHALLDGAGHSGTSAEKPATFENVEFFYRRARIEVIHGLGFAAELAGFIVGVDKPFKQRYSQFFKEFLAQSSKDLGDKVAEYSTWFFGQLQLVNRAAGAILVREKEDIALQTDGLQWADKEAQTGDMEKKPKKK